MLKEVAILRSEIDRLDAEVVELRAIISELITEMACLKANSTGSNGVTSLYPSFKSIN